MTAEQSRAAIATIRHDLKSGNLEHARRVAALCMEFEGVNVWEATPRQLKYACCQIEEALAHIDEATKGHKL